jgi:hypothetical protein
MLRPQQSIGQISKEQKGNDNADGIFPAHDVPLLRVNPDKTGNHPALQLSRARHVTPGKKEEDYESAREENVQHGFVTLRP